MSARPSPLKAADLDADPRLREVRALLRRVERRFRLQEIASLVPVALTLALGAIVVSAALRRFSGALSVSTLLFAGAGLVVFALISIALYALLKPRDLLATARRADLLLGLDERLSTALEDAATPPARPTPSLLSLRDAQLDDTLRSVADARPEHDLPVTLNWRRLLPAGALLVALMAVIFVPDFVTASPDKAIPAQVAVEQKNIDILKQAVGAQQRAAQDPTLQKLLQELDALSHDLKEGNLSKEEALARLSQTESELQKALDPQSPAQREALDQLAKQLSASGNESARQAGDALKNGDTQKAADALKKAADDVSKMSPEERKALADSLRQARDSTAALDPEMASRLNEAADALDNPDSAAAQDALKNLAQQVEQNGQKLATQQQVQQALAQIQQSKSNIAQAGQATPVPGAGTAVANGTPIGNGTPVSGTAAAGGTALAGTPVSGTAVAQGSPISGTPLAAGSATAVVVSGTVVAGKPSGTGTPVLVQGTPGKGTPVVTQGQNQGQGQGQSQGQGQGQGQGQSQGQGQGQSQSGSGQQSGQPSGGWGTGHQEQVYSPPSSVNSALTPVTVQGQNNPNGEQSSTTTNTDANNTGSSMVPYEQIYGQYKEQAGNALDSDYIPQGYKDLVKDYFTDIAP